MNKSELTQEINDKINKAIFDTEEGKLEWLQEINKEINIKIEELTDGYLKIIGAKDYFSSFKEENLNELKEYRVAITNELNMIRKKHEEIDKELKSGKLTKLISILSQLLELKSNLES